MTTKKAWIIRKQRYGNSGCKNPEERKRKIAKTMKKYMSKPEIKEKMKKHREERKLKLGYINSLPTRKKISKIMKEKWKNGEISKKQKETFHDGKVKGGFETRFKKSHNYNDKRFEVIKKLKEKRKQQILPIKDTKIEVKTQNFLKQLGIEFFTHQYMKIEHGYQCDILIPSMNMVIECDGDYWHKYPTGKEIDHIRTKELLKKGFKVLRLWEFEIKNMDLNKFKGKLK